MQEMKLSLFYKSSTETMADPTALIAFFGPEVKRLVIGVEEEGEQRKVAEIENPKPQRKVGRRPNHHVHQGRDWITFGRWIGRFESRQPQASSRCFTSKSLAGPGLDRFCDHSVAISNRRKN